MIVLLGAPVAAAYAPASAAGAVQVADPGDEDPVNGPTGMAGDTVTEQPGAVPGQEQNAMPGETAPGGAQPGEPKQPGNSGLLGGGGGKGGLLGLGLLGL
ncbi:hypothetical protein CCS38_30045 [Streptomyces purpurogeneiscleroticus]|nr:hypothetical protein [Streptomyces purpurogeneiscleroticus]